MRSIGLDVHRDFCEVAMLDSCGGRARGRIATTPEDLELFAQSLAPDDRVALEVTGNTWEIGRIIERPGPPRVGRGVLERRPRARPGLSDEVCVVVVTDSALVAGKEHHDHEVHL